jgi:hypothetical protein
VLAATAVSAWRNTSASLVTTSSAAAGFSLINAAMVLSVLKRKVGSSGRERSQLGARQFGLHALERHGAAHARR